MKFVLITKDQEMVSEAQQGFHPSDTLVCFENWSDGLDASEGAGLMLVDLIATLVEPNKIAGYEAFANAKMTHAIAKDIPLVLISPPPEYELDFMAGWPNFVYGNIQRPVNYKLFRRASTWV